jgi:hypothetical protein
VQVVGFITCIYHVCLLGILLLSPLNESTFSLPLISTTYCSATRLFKSIIKARSKYAMRPSPSHSHSNPLSRYVVSDSLRSKRNFQSKFKFSTPLLFVTWYSSGFKLCCLVGAWGGGGCGEWGWRGIYFDLEKRRSVQTGILTNSRILESTAVFLSFSPA